MQRLSRDRGAFQQIDYSSLKTEKEDEESDHKCQIFTQLSLGCSTRGKGSKEAGRLG